MNKRYFERVIRRERQSPADDTVRAALLALTPAYRLAVCARNASFNLGLRKPKRLPRPVVSVGNITTGGTGKTPTVAHLARRLISLNHRPAILTRGYGGDEPRELDTQLTPVNADSATWRTPILVSPNRYQAGLNALQTHPDISCFILDDGFQHRQLHRDLDLVLIDATQPFGYGHLLPAGMLREPLAALRRSHAILITRADQVSPDQLTQLNQQLEQIAGRPPIANTRHEWTAYIPAPLDTADTPDHPPGPLPLTALQDTPLVAICGIGNPDSFERTLRRHARHVIRIHRFADHHAYTRPELTRLIEQARRDGARAILTTAKDRVKWHPLDPSQHLDSPNLTREDWLCPLPIYCPDLAISFLNGEDQLDALLQQLPT